MDCRAFQQFAQTFVDGEFDGFEEAECRAHVSACPDCRAEIDRLTAFRALVRNNCPGAVAAPKELRSALCRALDKVPVVGTAAIARPMPRWMSVVTAVVASVILLIINLLPGGSPSTATAGLITEPIIEASVDWHRRNLPVEVTGPDAGVIREWFMDKVDFPVRLPTFDGRLHANVLGGRLNQINNQCAAHVLYEVEGAKVSIILFQGSNLRVPDREAAIPGRRLEYFHGNRAGYNVALFRDNGVTYAITTELPRASFNRLVGSLEFHE